MSPLNFSSLTVICSIIASTSAGESKKGYWS